MDRQQSRSRKICKRVKYSHQLNLNMKYLKKEFHSWIPKYTLKTTNYIPKYLERKQTTKPFLTLAQSIQNR